MASFFELENARGKNKREMEVDVYRRMECKACPLNKVDHPALDATGSKEPLIYILGEGPGAEEAEEGVQFVGRSGQLLRRQIPAKFRNRVRFNNVVRHRPPGNRNPEFIEIECCRPSIVKDIERSKPKAIFGFGNVPLAWVSGFNGISLWRGRKMPVQVGSHKCWYYAFGHPTYILRMGGGRDGDISEEERMFRLDLERAFAEVESLPKPDPHSIERAKSNLTLFTGTGRSEISRIRDALRSVARESIIGFDYETDRLRPYNNGARILTASVGTPTSAFAFGLEHPEAGWSRSEADELWELLWNFLRHCKARKAVHNLKFEMEWTAVFGGKDILRCGRWEDSMTSAAILDERRGKIKPGPFSLEFQVQQYFGFNLKDISDVDTKKLAKMPLGQVLQYNCLDGKYHAALFLKHEEELREKGLWEAYNLALRRVPTLTLTQLKGVPVDQEAVSSLLKKYEKQLKETEAKIKADANVKKFESKKGRPYAHSSNADALYLFKDIMKRSEVKKYDKKKRVDRYSVDEDVLTKIDEPIAKLHLVARKAAKIKSTYLEAFQVGSELLYDDGMLHAEFNPVWAETGRLSSEGPNLQNIPARDSTAREVRKAFIARPRRKGKNRVWALDYGQIEARVIAMFTRDPVHVKYCWDRNDIHGEWTERLAHAYPSRIGGKKYLTDKKVMKAFRSDVKNEWTFPLFFGATSQSVAGYTRIPEHIIKPHFNAFWKQYARAREWQEETLEFYKKNGFVECLTKRRRRGPLTINQVYNSGVQGTAAEIIMDGMSRLSEKGDWEIQPEINVHDDLTFLTVPEECEEEVIEKVLDILLDVKHFSFINVPITIEAKTGPNWCDLEEVGTFSSDTWFKGRR